MQLLLFFMFSSNTGSGNDDWLSSGSFVETINIMRHFLAYFCYNGCTIICWKILSRKSCCIYEYFMLWKWSYDGCEHLSVLLWWQLKDDIGAKERANFSALRSFFPNWAISERQPQLLVIFQSLSWKELKYTLNPSNLCMYCMYVLIRSSRKLGAKEIYMAAHHTVPVLAIRRYSLLKNYKKHTLTYVYTWACYLCRPSVNPFYFTLDWRLVFEY